MRNFGAVLLLSLLLLVAFPAGAQDSGEPLPKLVSHGDAAYPQIAKTAHIMGDVVVRITTDGQSVIEAVAESGPLLLRRASEDNAKTWKFAPHIPGTFRVTYSYEFVTGDVFTSFPNSTAVVEISAVPPTAIIDYAWIGLGKWKAELRSPHGRLAEVFEFSFSGPHGEWLDVDIPGAPDQEDKDESDDDEVSRKDGDFLVFSMKITEPDGKRLKTYFAGKMYRDKIVGTFVDESGARGTWTATRVVEPEKK